MGYSITSYGQVITFGDLMDQEGQGFSISSQLACLDDHHIISLHYVDGW